MQDNEYLGIHIRSSMAVKRHLRLVNNEGIVDADTTTIRTTKAICCWPWPTIPTRT